MNCIITTDLRNKYTIDLIVILFDSNIGLLFEDKIYNVYQTEENIEIKLKKILININKLNNLDVIIHPLTVCSNTHYA